MFENSYKRMNDIIKPDRELIEKTLGSFRKVIKDDGKKPSASKQRKLILVITTFILVSVIAFGINFYLGITFPDTSKISTGKYIPSSAFIGKSRGNKAFSKSYISPKNGSCLYVIEVERALDMYAWLDVEFYVGIIIVNNTPTPIDKESERQELLRLNELGYHVGYAEAWEYKSPEEKMKYTYIAGYFSASELVNFPAAENYGYLFYFALNGDGSPVDGGDGIIVDFSTPLYP